MQCGSFRHKWLIMLCAFALLLAALPTRPTQAVETAISIDCNSITAVPEDLCSVIQKALIYDISLLSNDRAYTVSSLRQTDTWALAVLIPTRVVQAQWDGFTDQDILEVLAYRPTSGLWEAGLAGSSSYTHLIEAVPSSFLEQKSTDGPVIDAPAFLFPWSQPQYWYKTQGWHDGNALDFQPVVRSNPPVDFAVLAAAEGNLGLTCDDGTTAVLSIRHSDGSMTSYAHLRASTIPRQFLGRQIPRGQFLGQIYSTGSGVGGAFRFGCGWGTAAHLHFVLSSRSVIIDNRSAESVSSAAFATQFRSSNQRVNGCAIGVGDGTSRPQMFIDVYNRKGGLAVMGCPINGVHWWGDGDRAVTIQDFSGGPVGNAAIIHDEKRDSPMNSIPAYAVQGGIWQYYLQLGGWQSWLGPPTSDEFTNETGQPQSNFRNGYINYRSGNPEAVAWPNPIAQQWRAEYHDGTNTNGFPTWVRNESAINYDWVAGAPGGGRWGVWTDNFSARWTGNFWFGGGTYTFTVSVDDGARVWVDGELIIDRWQTQPGTYQASRTLAAGFHTIKVESFEAGGYARTLFSWASGHGGGGGLN